MAKIKRMMRKRQHIVGGRTRRLFNRTPRRDVNNPRKRNDWGLLALQPNADLIIPKSSFASLAKDIMENTRPGENYQIDQLALTSLQECAEAHIVQEFEMATVFTARASRATIQVKDMKDAKFIGDLRDGLAVQLEDAKDTKKMKKMEDIKERTLDTAQRFIHAMVRRASRMFGHRVEIVKEDGENQEEAEKRLKTLVDDSAMVLLLQMMNPEKAGLRWVSNG
ncbi:hypothetical protein BCON_0060g00180 [Botryotinia convoluta]|uniref:Core Histone H2A/H2B/H3 domain-containing protein n=1 Tax=Botryotinia convoluta TaxID=54673 RepID=A0A4Z1IBC4_9HELO|nr:hypothetical protein BCON_0060g00180 [Botryotinia convoluta]